jgi:6-phosphogluconolactonase (cycloisomerase 2 family)
MTMGISKAVRVLLILGVMVGLASIPTAVAAPNGNPDILTYVETEYDSPGLDGATAVAISPDGNHVYVASNVDNGVSVFARNSASGRMTFVHRVTDGDSCGASCTIDGLDGATSVAVSPDGDHVYVAGKDDDAVVVFYRGSTSGMLTYASMVEDGPVHSEYLDSPRSIAISPDGEDVYVGSCYDDAIVKFNRNGTTGALTGAVNYVEGFSGIIGLNCAQSVAATNFNVYAVGLNDDAVLVFDRDTNGYLTYLETEWDGVNGVNGLDAPRTVVVGGGMVYVSGSEDDAVAVFDIAPSDGQLDYFTRAENGSLGASGLNGAWGLGISPDGLHVYAGSFHDNAIVTLQYFSFPGHILFFKGKLVDDAGGVDGIDGATSVVVSPDGNHVYVTGVRDDSVAAFQRDNATGMLTFVAATDNVDGLDAAWSVAVSPDGGHVYVASAADDVVSIFNRSQTTGAVSFEDVVTDGGLWMA